jgi:hypothetical protein
MLKVSYWTLCALSLTTYIVALVLELFPGSPGWEALLFGWLFVAGTPKLGPIALSWLANPSLLVAWILNYQGQNRSALICATAAVILGLCFLLGGHIPSNEADAGTRFTSEHRGPAYASWMVSLVLTFGAISIRRWSRSLAPGS